MRKSTRVCAERRLVCPAMGCDSAALSPAFFPAPGAAGRTASQVCINTVYRGPGARLPLPACATMTFFAKIHRRFGTGAVPLCWAAPPSLPSLRLAAPSGACTRAVAGLRGALHPHVTLKRNLLGRVRGVMLTEARWPARQPPVRSSHISTQLASARGDRGGEEGGEGPPLAPRRLLFTDPFLPRAWEAGSAPSPPPSPSWRAVPSSSHDVGSYQWTARPSGGESHPERGVVGVQNGPAPANAAPKSLPARASHNGSEARGFRRCGGAGTRQWGLRGVGRGPCVAFLSCRSLGARMEESVGWDLLAAPRPPPSFTPRPAVWHVCAGCALARLPCGARVPQSPRA